MEESKPSILVVEDDKRLCDINCRALESEGYVTKAAYTLAEARRILKEAPKQFDIILLDVKLPDGMGFDLCREMRPQTSAFIIFLTSVTEDKGELEGLEAGGDDYLRKPYGIDLLRQRVKNALHRRAGEDTPGGRQSQLIKVGRLDLDILANRALVDGKELPLSVKEFAMLTFFAQNEGKVITTEQLLERIWNYGKEDSHIVKVAITRLRSKLKGSGHTIVFDKHGKGYLFEEE